MASRGKSIRENLAEMIVGKTLPRARRSKKVSSIAKKSAPRKRTVSARKSTRTVARRSRAA